MPSEVANRLHKLIEAFNAEVISYDAYEDGLAKLRNQYGAAQVDVLLRQGAPPAEVRTHTQHIHEYTSIQAAVAGDVYGDIYIVGERAESTKVLLAGYLRWLASRCGQLPLRGVREQKTATDVLNIGLDQVYTQLATTQLVKRESFKGMALKRFDALAYLKQHLGDHLVPSQRRIHAKVIPVVTQAKNTEKQSHARYKRVGKRWKLFRYSPPDVPLTTTTIELDVASDQLERLLRQAGELIFDGPQLVSEAIAKSSRLVLLGEPGSGKSIALRYLALTLARAGLDKSPNIVMRLEGWQTLGQAGRLIPVFMPLLPLAQRLAAHPGRNGSAADLWAAIDAHIIDRGATADIAMAIRAELARGHVLLLLDGLDEVAGGDSRRQVIDAVQAFATEQPHCRMVVACRVRAYLGDQNADWQLSGWTSVTLADWTPGQVNAFIAAWYTAAATASHMPDARRDEQIAVLQRAVAEREDLKRLSMRPLLLTIMALVHLNDGRLPEDRVTLYSRCLDILLGQWEIAGKDETVYGTLMQYIGLPDVDVKSLRPLLERVAYVAHQAATPGEVGRLRRADLRELVADALEQLKHINPYDGAKRFLEYTDVRAGLLQASDAGDAYAFPHQTFQEYLAGLELIRGVKFVDQIMERRNEDRWRVPIFLGIGHTVSEGVLTAPYQLFNRLLYAGKREETQRQRDLIFAVELAEDVGWDRLERGGEEFTALRSQLAKELVQIVEGTGLPAAERVHAGLLLERLDDSRDGISSLPPKMVTIAGGSFTIGLTIGELRKLPTDERQYYTSAQNNRLVKLVEFDIGRYLVTNAQFALFVADGGYDPNQPWWDAAGRDWLRAAQKTKPTHWNDERFGIKRPYHPVVGVTWYEATAFCRWLSQHSVYNLEQHRYILPSEAEWEYAARNQELRPYPWGSEEPDGERANFGERHQGTTAVGCFAAGTTPDEIYDMTGNVWEWTRSVYAPYPYNPGDGRESVDSPARHQFILRGGGWLTQMVYLRAFYRDYRGTPDDNDSSVGFRLARRLSL
jgi:formylglycine-generating enzyme required for sulfatase activity